MNKVQVLGTMTRNCEIRYTQGGTAVASFGVAWNDRRKDQNGQIVEKAHFFDVTAWGKTAENINTYFRKGSRILIDGRLDFSSWTTQQGEKRSKVGIVVEKFDFIDRKSDGQGQPSAQSNGYPPQGQPAASYPPQGSQGQPAAAPAQAAPEIPEIDISEEEIPF